MLKIHPKVYAAFVAVAIVALTAGNNALNGAQTWKEAAVQTAGAAFVAAIAYLKSGNTDAELAQKLQNEIDAHQATIGQYESKIHDLKTEAVALPPPPAA